MARYPEITRNEIVPHREFASKTCFGRLLPDNWAQSIMITPKPEIPDDSKACKEYLAKQDNLGLMKFVDYIISLFK
jgi:hypothetical protein